MQTCRSEQNESQSVFRGFFLFIDRINSASSDFMFQLQRAMFENFDTQKLNNVNSKFRL